MTIDKQLKDVKEWQEKNSLAINEIDKNVKKIMKSGGGGSTDLTEIETSLTSVENKITSVASGVETNKTEIITKLGEIETNLNASISEISTKIDNTNNTTEINNINSNITEITTKINTISSDMSNFSADINTISTQTDKIATMNNNITTINSNTATTNNNVSTIKTNVEKVVNKLPNGNTNNEILQKINEILKFVKSEDDKLFEEDPYKLDLTYTGKLQTVRNANNYDYIEQTTPFEANTLILICPVYCPSKSFKYKIVVNFTATEAMRIIFTMPTKSFYEDFEAGTHNKVVEVEENITPTTQDCFFKFTTSKAITINFYKAEFWGEDIIVFPKKHKYKVNACADKLVITKLENNNGYYLELDNNALYPYQLTQTYTLDKEQVIDYDRQYDYRKICNKEFALIPAIAWVNNDHKIYLDVGDGTYTKNYSSYYSINCEYAKRDSSYSYAVCLLTDITYRFQICLTKINASRSDYGRRELNNKDVYDCHLAKQFFNIDSGVTNHVFIASLYNGNNLAFLDKSNYLDIGYGKNVTAYHVKDNPNLINIYMNDNGYCVKKVLQVDFSTKELTLVSQKIIGTYDVYFETNSNVYLIEKNGELYMYKNQ